jgi:parallel beta-helix repeat protein
MKTLSVIILAICLFTIPLFATTIHVPSEQPTIQAGIDVAVDGDTVLVADGTYTGIGNMEIDFIGKKITVRTENGPDATIIDCKKCGKGFYFVSGEGSDAKLEGFTITNGNTSFDDGGGISCYSSSPIIANCIITGNMAACYGGGIYCNYNSSPTITNCTISGNVAEYDGGGIYCTFSSPTITNCIISENMAEYDDGGGIYCYHKSSPTIANCTITGNTAEYDGSGGGIYCFWNSSPTVTNCTISENTAYSSGGGICSYSSSPIIANCIMWNDSPDEMHIYSGNPIVTYSDIQGGWEGEGNINEDPRFFPFPIRGFEYVLRQTSPCIDTGDPKIEDRLYDWYKRWPKWYPDGVRSDMGAYGGPGNIDWVR